MAQPDLWVPCEVGVRLSQVAWAAHAVAAAVMLAEPLFPGYAVAHLQPMCFGISALGYVPLRSVSVISYCLGLLLLE
jgi:hypothetical protein